MAPWHSTYFDLNIYILHCQPLKISAFPFASPSMQNNNLSENMEHIFVLRHTHTCKSTCLHAPTHTGILTLAVLYSLIQHSHSNRRNKSLWELPPCLQTADHPAPVRLSFDTRQCKNNMAALKKAPGERRRGSRKHFCLFLMGHPRMTGIGYLSQIHGGEDI